MSKPRSIRLVRKDVDVSFFGLVIQVMFEHGLHEHGTGIPA